LSQFSQNHGAVASGSTWISKFLLTLFEPLATAPDFIAPRVTFANGSLGQSYTWRISSFLTTWFLPRRGYVTKPKVALWLPWEQQQKNLNRNAVAPRVANTANLLTRDGRNRVGGKTIAHSPPGSPKRQPWALW